MDEGNGERTSSKGMQRALQASGHPGYPSMGHIWILQWSLSQSLSR